MQNVKIPTIEVPVPVLQQMVDILQELPHKQVAGVLSNLQQWQSALESAKEPDPEGDSGATRH